MSYQNQNNFTRGSQIFAHQMRMLGQGSINLLVLFVLVLLLQDIFHLAILELVLAVAHKLISLVFVQYIPIFLKYSPIVLNSKKKPPYFLIRALIDFLDHSADLIL